MVGGLAAGAGEQPLALQAWIQAWPWHVMHTLGDVSAVSPAVWRMCPAIAWSSLATALDKVCAAAAAAAAGAWVLGPRTGRFINGKPQPMPGHNSVFFMSGVLLLWFGFYGYVAVHDEHGLLHGSAFATLSKLHKNN